MHFINFLKHLIPEIQPFHNVKKTKSLSADMRCVLIWLWFSVCAQIYVCVSGRGGSCLQMWHRLCEGVQWDKKVIQKWGKSYFRKEFNFLCLFYILIFFFFFGNIVLHFDGYGKVVLRWEVTFIFNFNGHEKSKL